MWCVFVFGPLYTIWYTESFFPTFWAPHSTPSWILNMCNVKFVKYFVSRFAGINFSLNKYSWLLFVQLVTAVSLDLCYFPKTWYSIQIHFAINFLANSPKFAEWSIWISKQLLLSNVNNKYESHFPETVIKYSLTVSMNKFSTKGSHKFVCSHLHLLRAFFENVFEQLIN